MYNKNTEREQLAPSYVRPYEEPHVSDEHSVVGNHDHSFHQSIPVLGLRSSYRPVVHFTLLRPSVNVAYRVHFSFELFSSCELSVVLRITVRVGRYFPPRVALELRLPLLPCLLFVILM
jgi:hypothetical protein